jgi:hypothetical protein
MVPSRRGTHQSPAIVIICQVSSNATNAPTMGVHNPKIRRSPNPARNADITIELIGGALRTAELARTTSAAPTTKRMRINPMPGKPSAKVEYRRRNTKLSLLHQYPTCRGGSITPKGGEIVTL